MVLSRPGIPELCLAIVEVGSLLCGLETERAIEEDLFGWGRVEEA